jgi:hypothetical protein
MAWTRFLAALAALWRLITGRTTVPSTVPPSPTIPEPLQEPKNAPPSPVPHETTPEPSPAPIAAPEPNPAPETRRETLYLTAKNAIGEDLTPGDEIPDGVACVAQLQAVFHRAFGQYIGTDAARYNTAALAKALQADPQFSEIPISQALPGDIAVAATGEGRDKTQHGHCWIAGKQAWMSNDSGSGLWKANYTKDAILSMFVAGRGFPLHAFRLVGPLSPPEP